MRLYTARAVPAARGGASVADDICGPMASWQDDGEGRGAGGGWARPRQPVCRAATTPQSGPLSRMIHAVAGLRNLAPLDAPSVRCRAVATLAFDGGRRSIEKDGGGVSNVADGGKGCLVNSIAQFISIGRWLQLIHKKAQSQH